MTTFCEDCDNVHAESRKQHPSRWLCSQFPRLEGQGFVTRTGWADQEPFMRCVNINGGVCKLFRKRRDGQQENGL